MSAAEKKTVFRIATVLGTMRQQITAIVQCLVIAQKLKQGNIFWKNSYENTSKQALLQPGNIKGRFYVPNKNSGEVSVYVLMVLREGGWTTLQTKQGGSLWGIDAPASTSTYPENLGSGGLLHAELLGRVSLFLYVCLFVRHVTMLGTKSLHGAYTY